METKCRVNFGSLVAVMNSQGEILVVNSFNEVQVKRVEDVTQKDHISFKVLDLRYPPSLKR